MQTRTPVDRNGFDEKQIKILIDAFEEALFLAEITDRTSPRAESVALRIIEQYDMGERDPKRICRLVVSN